MKSRNTAALIAGMLAIASLQAARAEHATTNDLAVTCAKCETTWVTQPEQVGKATVYRTQKKMDCEDCTSAVANFFKTGTFAHTCKTCIDLGACQTRQHEASPTANVPARAVREGSVMCSKCQAVWVRKSQNTGKFTSYWYEKKDPCGGCQDMAMEMVSTGKAEGHCAKCGDGLKACAL